MSFCQSAETRVDRLTDTRRVLQTNTEPKRLKLDTVADSLHLQGLSTHCQTVIRLLECNNDNNESEICKVTSNYSYDTFPCEM